MSKPNQEIDIEKAEKAGIRFFSSAEEQELAYLREAVKKTDEERFFYLMKLMKMQRAMQEVKFVDK